MSTLLQTKIKTSRVVELNLSPEDWEIYSSMEGSTNVAEILNYRVAKAISTSSTRTKAHRKAYEAMSFAQRYGALDTEPQRVLDLILDEVFGEKA